MLDSGLRLRRVMQLLVRTSLLLRPSMVSVDTWRLLGEIPLIQIIFRKSSRSQCIARLQPCRRKRGRPCATVRH
jgi:hypothetical protein